MHTNTYAHKKNSRVRKWIGIAGPKMHGLVQERYTHVSFQKERESSESLNDLILDPPPHLPKLKKTHSGKMKRYALEYAIEFVLYFVLKDNSCL